MPGYLLATLLAVVLLAGCSAEGGGGSSAADLSEGLPEGDGTVHYVDLVGLKVAFGVDLGADPLEAARDDFGYFQLLGAALPVLSHTFDPELNAALDLDDATEIAGSGGSHGSSVIRSDGDLEQIAAQLEQIGFEPEGEFLVRSGGEGGPVAVRLADDLIYLAARPELLPTTADDDGDPPAPVIADLEGLAISVEPGDGDCVLSTAAVTTADGAGEIVFEVDDDAVPNGPGGSDPSGELTIGETIVDDNLAIVPLSGGERQSAPAPVALENEYLEYDCDAA